MIIEDLIRLGKPLLNGRLTPKEILELITDVSDQKVKNFFRHIFVVELPSEGSDNNPATLPMQVWGQEEAIEGQKKRRKRMDFIPDVRRAIGTPFVLPVGGNPLHPQGRYGVPVYPCWDPHLRDFRESPEAVSSFLNGRIERTASFSLAGQVTGIIANGIHKLVAQLTIGSHEKVLGLIVLAQCHGSMAPFTYSDHPSDSDLGRSRLHPEKFIVPLFDNVLKAVWSGKIEEGKNMGSREGVCSICGQGEQVISSYCKAWPWALPEWSCPLPQGGNEKLMVEGIALDEQCYQALTLGACVFGKLTRLVHPMITHELFSPVADREGRNTATGRKLRDLPTIRGTAYVLPLLDELLNEENSQEVFSSGIQGMLSFPMKQGVFLERYMDTVTGFDVFLPEEVERVDFRLMLAYFHGDVGRGDVHLRAFIQDVLPSTLRQLKEIAQISAEEAIAILKALSPNASEKQVAYQRILYRSVPWILVRAYGGSYVWHQLEAVLRRKVLDVFRPTLNAAKRMNSLAARYPDTRFDLNDEVLFYLTFLDFLARYNEWIGGGEDGQRRPGHFDERSLGMGMRPWKELLKAISERPVEELRYASPAELGFGCGVLLRQFGRWYWNATKVGQKGKDYLKHRVITFGSDLSPDSVWKRGLAKVFDVAARYNKLHISEDFRQRVGVTLAEFDRLQEEIRTDRDAFMSAFWSGHALQGYDHQPSQDTTIEIERTERSDQWTATK